jgi:hypothetical protein
MSTAPPKYNEIKIEVRIDDEIVQLGERDAQGDAKIFEARGNTEVQADAHYYGAKDRNDVTEVWKKVRIKGKGLADLVARDKGK